MTHELEAIRYDLVQCRLHTSSERCQIDYAVRLHRLLDADQAVESPHFERNLFMFACLVRSHEKMERLIEWIDFTTFHDAINMCQRYALTHMETLRQLLHHWRKFDDIWCYDMSMEIALCLDDVAIYHVFREFAPTSPITNTDGLNPFAIAAIYDLVIPMDVIARIDPSAVLMMLFYDLYCSINAGSWRAFCSMWDYIRANPKECAKYCFEVPIYTRVLEKSFRYVRSVSLIQKTWRRHRCIKRKVIAAWVCKSMGLPPNISSIMFQNIV